MASFVLYGPLRRWAGGAPVQVTIAPNASLGDAREALIAALRARDQKFSADDLVRASAFGSDTSVLADDAQLEASGTYAVLPPVAGG